MVLSPRQAVQSVSDKLEEWWVRFVTPDAARRRRRNAAAGADENDDDDILLDGDHDDDDEDDVANAAAPAGRRLSILVNTLFQEAKFPRMPPLPQQLPHLPTIMMIPSREQLGVYFAEVGAQMMDRLSPLLRVPTLPSLPRPDQLPEFPELPTMKDIGNFASSCWEAAETSYGENKAVYRQSLKWSVFVLVYLLAMLLCSSQCCLLTPSASSTLSSLPSAVEGVKNLQHHRPYQRKRHGKQYQQQQEARNKQQQDVDGQKPAAATATVGRKNSWLSSLFWLGKTGAGIIDKNNNTSSSSLVPTTTTTTTTTTSAARHDLDGACASTSLSASGGNNKKQHRNVTSTSTASVIGMPPPPLWFTFVRKANTLKPPTLPPIARRMVKDVDGYYVEDDFDKRTVLPPPGFNSNRSTTMTTRGGGKASFLKSMDVAGVKNIDMEEEREKEKKTANSGILYPAAFSTQPVLQKQDVGFLHAWSRRITSEMPDINERSWRVSWGGGIKDDIDSTLWWQDSLGQRTSSYFSWWKSHSTAAKDPLQEIDGGHLLYCYYQVLLPQFIQDPSKVTFPRHQLNHDSNLCTEHGCSTQVTIRHSLEFRESYQPWRPTAAMVQENAHGWIYARGLAKKTPTAVVSAASTKQVASTKSNNNVMYAGQHAMIWARPGQHTIQDPLAYNRAILQTLEQGIATSLKRSHGQVGRFNVVIDASGLEWSKLPDMATMKQLLHVFQDHYPGRLGAIFMFNLSPSAFVYLKFILKSMIDREVRQKIYLLSRNPVQRLAQLESVVDIKDIPEWIKGGQDAYEFDAKTYYTSASKTWRDDDKE
jgi:CRAL/TRIO domain